MSVTTPPTSDYPLLAWSANWDEKITLAPTDYGLVAGQATAYHTDHTDFATKLAILEDPATNNKVTRGEKNTAKRVLLAAARQLIKIVQAFPALTDAQRDTLQINIRDSQPTPAPVPSTQPFVAVDPDGWVRIQDETEPKSHAKPVGVRGAVVTMRILGQTDPAPTTLVDAPLGALATKWMLKLPLPEGSNGKVLYVAARWFNTRGQLGPEGPIVSTTIAA